MLCASLRASLRFAVARNTVWFINNLYGPLPTTYTWGYYRSDVSFVFGKWLDKAFIASIHAGTRIVSTARACRAVTAYATVMLHTSSL